MRALLSTRVGGPEALELLDVPEPVPGAGQVAVAVHACGVNFPDTLVIEDKYQLRPQRPFSPGSELSGVVKAVGEGVAFPGVGDRISASLPFGAMAEVVLVPANRCSVIPDAMPFDEAAAFQVTYGTVWYALCGRAAIQTGETLLVLGAGGGIGLAAVELGKALGARVIACASSPEKLEMARELGADILIQYPSDAQGADQGRAFTEQIRAVCGDSGVDVIVDPVGGSYAQPALRALAWEGRYLVIGFAGGIPSIPLNLTLLKGCSIIGVFWGAHMARSPEKGAADMRSLLALYSEGRIRPRVSARYPLAEGGEAIRRLSSRGVWGKIVVEVAVSGAAT
jgi:NADPH2:quinone reductase